VRWGRSGLVEAFRRDGYAIVPALVPPEAVGALRDAIEAAPERDPRPNPLSLGTMRFASNLFYGSPELQAFLTGSVVTEIVTALVGPDVWVRWDQAVWKRPGAPEFPLHQDNGYTGLGIEHLQLWVALTDSDAENGGLEVIPGGHRAPLDHRWEGGHVVTEHPGPRAPVAARPGDAVAFSSLLPHATAPNVSDRERLAYVAEFLPLDAADPSVATPHLQVVEGGRPCLRWLAERAGGPASKVAPDRRS
jgi:ectoine hydroxylase-related dioxygenase (phytanoyl-CoA dioxygenase family)